MSGAPTATTGPDQARRTGLLTAAAAVVLPLAVLAGWCGDVEQRGRPSVRWHRTLSAGRCPVVLWTATTSRKLE